MLNSTDGKRGPLTMEASVARAMRRMLDQVQLNL